MGALVKMIGLVLARSCYYMDPIIFKNFIRASLEVTDALETDCSLNDMDQLRLENYLSVIQMAYMEWKRRNLSRNSSDLPVRFLRDR